MYGLSGKKKIGKVAPFLEPHFNTTLSDYVTAIAWSPDGKTLAASSAAGEVILWQGEGSLSTLQHPTGQSIDSLSFSQDGQFLAAGGQDGRVPLWHLQSGELINTLEFAPAWVDQLAWSFTGNQLAFNLGRYVQVWDVEPLGVVTTLNFESSSVLGIGWHPVVEHLAISGYQGVKIWNGEDWDDDPYVLEIPSASVAIAWSPNGKYLASGNLDRTVVVIEWGNPHPWVMRGFPGKVRQLTWSTPGTALSAPLLAAASAETITIWKKKQGDESVGWEAWTLEFHERVVQAIAFQPNTFLFASAAEDGQVCLWHQAKQLGQILDGAPDGFSCLAWHPQGQFLAAGGKNGELLLWSKSMRGQGFGRR